MPFTAELGGKGPLLVFADSDLDAAAKKAAWQFDDSGQVCLAGTRLLVEESIKDDFLDRFHAHADALVLGDSRDPGTDIARSPTRCIVTESTTSSNGRGPTATRSCGAALRSMGRCTTSRP